MPSRAEVDGALAKARAFVVRQQRPDGEMPVVKTVLSHDGVVERSDPDGTVFMTMYLALALVDDPTPEMAACVRRAEAFTRDEMKGPGVWRFHARSAPLWAVTACDCDTTAGVLLLRRRLGLLDADVKWLLRTNRDRRGCFLTWFTPGNVRTLNPRYWWFVLRDLNLARAFLVWRRTSARRNDRDAVVNANVIHYLGDDPAVRPAIEWILETIRLGAEQRRDRWYQSRATLYHAMGRAYRGGIVRFAEVRDTMVSRLADDAAANGAIGGGAINTALSAAALMYFGETGNLVDRAVDYLVASQDDEGAWPNDPFFYGGWNRLAWWGSRETTTAFAIEALNLYRMTLDG